MIEVLQTLALRKDPTFSANGDLCGAEIVKVEIVKDREGWIVPRCPKCGHAMREYPHGVVSCDSIETVKRQFHCIRDTKDGSLCYECFVVYKAEAIEEGDE